MRSEGLIPLIPHAPEHMQAIGNAPGHLLDTQSSIDSIPDGQINPGIVELHRERLNGPDVFRVLENRKIRGGVKPQISGGSRSHSLGTGFRPEADDSGVAKVQPLAAGGGAGF